MNRVIRLKVLNGLWYDYVVDDILKPNGLTEEYQFINDESKPDFIIFGPYGNDLPPKGPYVRIGYYCENIIPDLAICEWAFGVPYEDEINNPRYKRIQWQGLNPEQLIKKTGVDEIFEQKTKFCNFLYSNPIAYREEFFKQLCGYKKVDAPGKSMNNMPPIDEQYTGGKYEIKRKFLSAYKFTIAFESYVYPGYQTEKLYDAMQSNSIPIYCGDPLVNDIFNPDSFINAFDYLKVNNSRLKNFLEKFSLYDFKDYLPATYDSLYYKVRRKLKMIAKAYKMRIQLDNLDYSALIERIKELDNNPELYKAMLRQPWFKNNEPPAGLSSKNRWIEIFNSR